MEDSKIIELFFSRNEEAITQTDAAYGRRLFHLADGILRCPEDAEESVSDTYWKAWDTIPPTRPAHLFGYLAKICRHFAFGRLDRRNAAKRRAEIVSLTQEMENCIPDSRQNTALSEKELGNLLSKFLRTLSPENRMVFLRRYWYVDTVAEIAQRYGISESAVMTRLSRTRSKLARYLSKEGIPV
nr:sigma-70 family RNA polymerase sigma factor [Oscillospiraceae bacterium]